MVAQQDPPPGEGRCCLFYGSHWGLQGTLGQAADGAGEDLELQGAVADEQEE